MLSCCMWRRLATRKSLFLASVLSVTGYVGYEGATVQKRLVGAVRARDSAEVMKVADSYGAKTFITPAGWKDAQEEAARTNELPILTIVHNHAQDENEIRTRFSAAELTTALHHRNSDMLKYVLNDLDSSHSLRDGRYGYDTAWALAASQLDGNKIVSRMLDVAFGSSSDVSDYSLALRLFEASHCENDKLFDWLQAQKVARSRSPAELKSALWTNVRAHAVQKGSISSLRFLAQRSLPTDGPSEAFAQWSDRLKKAALAFDKHVPEDEWARQWSLHVEQQKAGQLQTVRKELLDSLEYKQPEVFTYLLDQASVAAVVPWKQELVEKALQDDQLDSLQHLVNWIRKQEPGSIDARVTLRPQLLEALPSRRNTKS